MYRYIETRMRLALIVFITSAVLSLFFLFLVQPTTTTTTTMTDTNARQAATHNIDALNRTMGFHRIYSITSASKITKINAISNLLDLNLTHINTTTPAQPQAQIQIQPRNKKHQTESTIPPTLSTDFLTHKLIYKDMVENNIQTALILGPNIDMELDIKQILCRVQYRLTFDLLFLCRSHSEPSEHGLSTLLQILRLTENDPDESHLEQLRNTKRDFLARSTAVYRSVDPRGGIENGYALSLRMAERLQKMDNSKEGVDFALRSTAVNQEFNLWSVSPPAITDSGACQYLKTSVLAAMSLRSDNPHDHPPYIDLQ